MNRLLAVHPGPDYAPGDVYSGIVPELEKLGIECIEYDLGARLDISNQFLNMIWRNRGRPKEKFTKADIVYGASKDVVERALWWNVDGVIIFCGMFLAGDAYRMLKGAKIRTAALLSESPYDDPEQARILPYVDVAWTNERSSVRVLRKANPNVNYMPHAYNPEIHKPEAADDPEVPAHDVVFVGSLFAERVDLLNAIDWTGIDLGLYGSWTGLPSRHRLRQYLRGGIVDNRYAAALYRKAKIGLNLYRESMGWGRLAPKIAHAESINPRTLELAACGCFQISQARAEIDEVFGGAVPTFKTAAELDHLIHWYLDPTVERPTAAKRRRALAQDALDAVQPHTFAARARTIVDDLGRAEWPIKAINVQTLALVG